MVHDLALAYERGQVGYAPGKWTSQAATENRRYESKPASTPGRSKYQAPSGMNDDWVSLCLQATVGARVLGEVSVNRKSEFNPNEDVDLAL
jgi:hypothetical protein